ncbi:MAG: ribonuclease P protein component [Simkaniaceae bacterium]|nr:ribonuclease P protein component [Candidatus Sacchlamyda saccharinae]
MRLNAFPKFYRIRTRSEYRQRRTRFYGDAIVIDSSPGQLARLGITAPKTYGNAVARNRFKRLVREVFRTSRHTLPPLDIVVLPKKGAGPVSLEIVKQDFSSFYDSQCTATTSR